MDSISFVSDKLRDSPLRMEQWSSVSSENFEISDIVLSKTMLLS